MATLKEMLVSLGSIRVVEPVIDVSHQKALEYRWMNQIGSDPHGIPWHVSFHASQFPGDTQQACGRQAMYGLMDIPREGPIDRWLDSVAGVGKEIEIQQVRAARDAGFLVRSNDVQRSTDPDADLPQIGFVDKEHWLTGSVDMPLLPFGYDSPFIVEVKTKHEDRIEQMVYGERGPDEPHRRQLLCSLGLAHENPYKFLHPTEDRILNPAQDGAIYYIARDSTWPGPVPTFEFFFSYDPAFMEAGRAHLKSWVEHFKENRLPQTVERKNSRSHPFGWKWSEGVCKNCPFKKSCKSDYEHAITRISDSHAVALAKFTRFGYDDKAKRESVLAFWDEQDASN